MSTAFERAMEQAQRLSTAERLQLAQELLEGLEGEDEDTVQAWEEEIERRIAKLDAGMAAGRSWDEIKKDFQLRYGR